MNVKFLPATSEEIHDLMVSYVDHLSYPIDFFLESHILKSQFYRIEYDSTLIGYTAIFESSLMTQFFLIDGYKFLAQDIFFQAKRLEETKELFVPTCDEFLLSLALDINRGVELQAYFFKESGRDVRELKVHEDFSIVKAVENDIELIEKESEDFFDDLERRISDEEIFIGRFRDEVVSFGIIECSKLNHSVASIGMFVLKNKRVRGFGYQTLLTLREQCHSMEKQPIAGCWYYNHNSKKTLEKAGMFSETRLLQIKL